MNVEPAQVQHSSYSLEVKAWIGLVYCGKCLIVILKWIFCFQKKDLKLLEQLTIKFFRTNSQVGNDNIDYLSVDVSNIVIGNSKIIQTYLFDPFNLPFDQIVCLYDPDINLGSKSRVRYIEIKKYL